MSIRATTPPGRIASYWYHGAGCHAWLVVTRDTLHARDLGVSQARGRSRWRASGERPDGHTGSPSGGLHRPVAAAALHASTARAITGYPGDTLASALLANGVRLVGRSFKYHRPRGILTAGQRGAERAGRVAQRRAARAQHARDDGRALRRARSRDARTAGRRCASICCR